VRSTRARTIVMAGKKPPKPKAATLRAGEDDTRLDSAKWKRRLAALREPAPLPSDAKAKDRSRKKKELTELRVILIIELMAKGMYVPGLTDQHLATAWALSVSRVRELTSEGSRRFSTEVWPEEKKAEFRAHGMQNLARIAVKLEAIGTVNALREAREAVKTLMHFAGLDPATKLEHTGKDGAPLASEPTPEMAAALVRAAFGDQARRAMAAAEELEGVVREHPATEQEPDAELVATDG